MEEKPKHKEAGLDPFTFAKQEKKAKKEKQDLAELKNKVSAVKPGAMKDLKILGKNGDAPAGDNLKLREEKERTMLRKREHKSLMKSLTLAQMSTASMGKFDRKRKNEPDAPSSQKIKKKKSNSSLAALESNKASEKERNMKIFDMLQKKSDLSKIQTGASRSNAHLNSDRLSKRAKLGDEQRRRLTNK